MYRYFSWKYGTRAALGRVLDVAKGSGPIGRLRESIAHSRRAEMEEDISRFRTYFPDVAAKDIPEEVWAEVAQGVSLTHAYALYLAAAGYEDAKAQEINRVNSGRSAPVGGEAAEEALTKEQVENMSPQAVKKNYNRILSSIKSWRL